MADCLGSPIMAKQIRIDPDRLSEGWTRAGWDRFLSVQRPAVQTHLRSVRKHRPDATPEEIIRVLEQRYMATVTAAGTAVGLAAALPAVGTASALALSGGETAGFLEASALFAQSVAEGHGLPVDDPERASTLVMALMLGPAGANLVNQFASEARGKGPSRSAYWGEMVTQRLPMQLLTRLTAQMRRRFVRRFATAQGPAIVLRAVPFGIGAVIGGTGNHLAGKKVVTAARQAFGPARAAFPDQVAGGSAAGGSAAGGAVTGGAEDWAALPPRDDAA